MVEEVDAGVARGADERAHRIVFEVLDAHEAEHDVGCGALDAAEFDGLHWVRSRIGSLLPGPR
ncbi:hypothetical protein [Microbacterium sp. LWH7-1.2]|uniref:hypothetical protein n=1 Tax=Microbacterium sp. LWH7-1.2 TaxID=3135257 RepID=UPI0031395EAC